MSTSQTSSDRSRRVERLALVLLIVGMLTSLVWLVHDWYDPTNDGAMYVLTGRSLVRGEGYSMLGMPFRIRPPGFTLLIAPILALFGTSFFALNLFVSLFGVLGCVLLYFFARARIGWVAAWVLAAVVWLNPGYQVLCTQVMSDVPGTALMFACLLLERRWRSSPSPRRDALLGVAIALSAYVRTVNILLVPAIVVMRLVRRAWPPGGEAKSDGGLGRWLRGAVILSAAAFLVQLPWSVRNQLNEPEGPVDQTLLYSYSTGMWNSDMGDPDSPRLSVGEVLGRFPERGAQAFGVLAGRLIGTDPGPPWIGALLLGSVLYVLVKRRGPSELFAVGAFGIITVYFGFAPRLLLPILVLALLAAAELVRDLARATIGRLVPEPFRESAAAGVCALALVGLLAHDAEPRRDWDKVERGHAKLMAIVTRFEARIEDDAVLASNRAWHYAVLMDRPVYALEMVLKRFGTPSALEELIDKYGVNTVVLSPLRVQDRLVLPYFDAKYGPQTDEVARVYRVR